MIKLAIVGSQHLGGQILNIAQLSRYHIVGFYDDFVVEGTTVHKNYEVIGGTKDIVRDFNLQKFDQIILAIGYKHLDKKKEIYQYLLERKVPFATIIHPSCIIDPSAVIEQGCVLYAGCIIDQNVKLKPNSLLNLGCIIAHDTTIGSSCFLAPGCTISGFVQVGHSVFLGSNTSIRDNTAIAARSHFGLSSVIVNDIKQQGLYVGSPARLLKSY